MRFEDIKIGQEATVSHTITMEDIGRFIQITNDDNAVHTSDKYGPPVVHGMLSASFISTIIGKELPGEGALWFSQNMEFRNPARVGDTLRVVARVLSRDERERSIVLSTDVFNQNGVTIISGSARVKVLEPKEGHAPPLSPQERLTALVVGSRGGIGREVVNEFVKMDFNVIEWDIRGDPPINVEECGGELLFPDNVDVLVNCASVPMPDTPFELHNLSNLGVQVNFHLNLNARLAAFAIDHMKKQKYGKIIFIGTTAMDHPHGHWWHYITAKEALWGLAKALSYELAPQGIRVNMVSPSLMETLLTANIPQKTKLILESQSPLRKMITPSDVAKVIAFLASPLGDNITGQNIRING